MRVYKVPIQYYYPKIFIKLQRQIMFGSNFYVSDITCLLGKYLQSTHHQKLWDTSTKNNNYIGLFTTHSLTNSRFTFNRFPNRNMHRAAEFISHNPEFTSFVFPTLVKFGYSENATKFEKIFHIKFDVTE